MLDGEEQDAGVLAGGLLVARQRREQADGGVLGERPQMLVQVVQRRRPGGGGQPVLDQSRLPVGGRELVEHGGQALAGDETEELFKLVELRVPGGKVAGQPERLAAGRAAEPGGVVAEDIDAFRPGPGLNPLVEQGGHAVGELGRGPGGNRGRRVAVCADHRADVPAGPAPAGRIRLLVGPPDGLAKGRPVLLRQVPWLFKAAARSARKAPEAASLSAR